MPVLMSTADISAEILVGAAGCASGNHTWSGMMPAFTPKPRKKSANSPSRAGPTGTPDNRLENDSDRNGEKGKDQEEPRRQPVHRVSESELRRSVDEQDAMHRRSPLQHGRGRQPGDDRGGRRSEERKLAGHAGPPRREHRHRDDP